MFLITMWVIWKHLLWYSSEHSIQWIMNSCVLALIFFLQTQISVLRANTFKELLISRQWCFSGFSNDEYAEPVEVFDIFFWIRFKRQCFVRMPAGYRRLLFLVLTIFFCPVLHLNKIHLVNIFQLFKFCRTISLNPSNSVS